MGMFEKALNFGSYTTVALNVAFKSGSSKDGNAARAKMDSNCVPAMYLYGKYNRSTRRELNSMAIKQNVNSNSWLFL